MILSLLLNVNIGAILVKMFRRKQDTDFLSFTELTTSDYQVIFRGNICGIPSCVTPAVFKVCTSQFLGEQ